MYHGLRGAARRMDGQASVERQRSGHEINPHRPRRSRRSDAWGVVGSDGL